MLIIDDTLAHAPEDVLVAPVGAKVGGLVGLGASPAVRSPVLSLEVSANAPPVTRMLADTQKEARKRMLENDSQL